MPLSVGDKLGPYEIIAPVGAGGMGEVFRARDKRLGRDVALKVLPAVFAQDGLRRARFEHEARSASARNHPNIISIFDIGRRARPFSSLTEFVDGDTLRALIRRGRCKREGRSSRKEAELMRYGDVLRPDAPISADPNSSLRHPNRSQSPNTRKHIVVRLFVTVFNTLAFCSGFSSADLLQIATLSNSFGECETGRLCHCLQHFGVFPRLLFPSCSRLQHSATN